MSPVVKHGYGHFCHRAALTEEGGASKPRHSATYGITSVWWDLSQTPGTRRNAAERSEALTSHVIQSRESFPSPQGIPIQTPSSPP